jgi:tetratricopeptide (TPR) repeat protein
MADCQLFGLDAGRHHLVNILLHGLNTVVLFGALLIMTGAPWRSAFVAALFAVHPLHVESVAWVAERKDLLSTLFGFLALAAYVPYARAPSATRYGLVALLFVLSLMSKAMWVTFPFLLLLLDYWPLGRLPLTGPDARRRARSLVLEKAPLLVISALASAVTIHAQRAAGALAPIEALPLSQRIGNALVAYAGYLQKAFWPVDLAVIYPLPESMDLGIALGSAAALAAATVICLAAIRRRPWLVVGWFWYLGMLVPVIGLVQVGSQAMADRYTYVPLIGVFIMIAWTMPAIPPVTAARVGLIGGAAAAVVTLAALTVRQVQTWRDSKSLFEHAVAVTTGNFMAHNLLASEYGKRGDLANANRHIDEALRIRPNYAGAFYNRAVILMQARDFTAAREYLQRALQTQTLDPAIWNALGYTEFQLKNLDDAVAACRRALELNPDYAEAFSNLSMVLLAQGKLAEAAEAGISAVRLKPDLADAHAALAAALLRLNRLDESITHSRQALSLNPTRLDSRMHLGIALLARGDVDEAITHFEHLQRLLPNDPAVQKALSAARQKRGPAPPRP